jgi:cysteine sulfinate desulfinase/cysteine desulfurase-like protein
MCSGMPSDPSPVLGQIGVPNTPGFRLGVGASTTDADVDALLGMLPELVTQLERVEATSTEALTRFRAPGS